MERREERLRRGTGRRGRSLLGVKFVWVERDDGAFGDGDVPGLADCC
jgi:hypothetical protein